MAKTDFSAFPYRKRRSSAAGVRDIVMGMSDGLTVPFALAAGLTGAVAASHIIVTAGIAEIAAGSISMGLGGYLSARTEAEQYYSEKRREEREVRETPDLEAEEVSASLISYGLSPEEVAPIVSSLRKNPKAWVEYMMRNELGLEEPHPKRAIRSAVTIALAYLLGGVVPLFPYFLVNNAREALRPSVLVTLLALSVFGYFKGKSTGTNPISGAVQTVAIGGLAATAAFLLASRL